MPTLSIQKRQVQCPPLLSTIALKRTLVTLIAIGALTLFGVGFLSYLQTSHPHLIGRMWLIKESTAFMMIGLGVVLGFGTLDILLSDKKNAAKKGEQTPIAPPTTPRMSPLATPHKEYDKLMDQALIDGLENDRSLMEYWGSPPHKKPPPPSTPLSMMSPDPCGDIPKFGSSEQIALIL